MRSSKLTLDGQTIRLGIGAPLTGSASSMGREMIRKGNLPLRDALNGFLNEMKRMERWHG